MELDELKYTWQSLDNRLKKQEILNTKLVKEMLISKSEKVVNRLINMEGLSIIILLLVIPAIIYVLGLDKVRKLDFYIVFLWAMLVTCIIGIVWQILKIYKLTRINTLKTLSNNIKHTNEYNILIKREKMVMIFFVPLLFFSVIFIFSHFNTSTASWAFLICLFIASAIYSYWAYKKLYDKNITSILKSFEELRELKEEEKE